jgi:hypothetical protein
VRRHCEVYAGEDVVPVVRALLERWELAGAGERTRIALDDRALSHYAPDIELRAHGGPGSFAGRGWDSVIQLCAAWYAAWDSYVYEVEEHRDVGRGEILTVTQVRAVGRGGIAVEMTGFEIRRARAGLIVSWEMFISERDALRAIEQR